MTEIPKEKQMEMAIEAFNKGQFPSKNACAKAFDVALRTLITYLNRVTSQKEAIANC